MSGKSRFNLTPLILLLIITIVGVPEKSFADGSNADATEFKISNEEKTITEVDCYEKNLKKLFILKIDFANQKIVEPKNLSWGILNTYPNSKERNLVLWNPKNEKQGFYTINLNEGTMQICMNDYVSSECESYQCYRKNTPIF